MSTQIHATSTPPTSTKINNVDDIEAQSAEVENEASINYMKRAQWLRAAVLGANDGLVSVASLMIGVGAVNQRSKAMLISGIAGLVAGACSMAIGEFVSVYTQYDIEVADSKRRGRENNVVEGDKETKSSTNPLLAAGASALAFAVGALLPLMAGGFIRAWGVRVCVVCLVSSFGLVGFGALGAVLGGAPNVCRSGIRVLIGGCLAMLVTYGVLRLFGMAFGIDVSTT